MHYNDNQNDMIGLPTHVCLIIRFTHSIWPGNKYVLLLHLRSKSNCYREVRMMTTGRFVYYFVVLCSIETASSKIFSFKGIRVLLPGFELLFMWDEENENAVWCDTFLEHADLWKI